MTLRMQQTPVEWDLLRDYVEHGSEQSFARLVAAHMDMVYSAALRQCGDRAMAEEVTQAVFIILARKAPKLKPGTVLGAWLHQTACYTALNAIKSQARRRRHEQKAAEMNAEIRRVDSSWHQLAPLLDEGVLKLGEKDRRAIVLRFFQSLSLSEVGLAMGISEDAAQMRVRRALERLRDFFRRRGIVLPSAGLGAVISLNAARSAPAGLAQSLASGALAAIPGEAPALVQAALRAMALAKAKAAATVVLMVACCAGAGLLLVHEIASRVPVWHGEPHVRPDDGRARASQPFAPSILGLEWSVHPAAERAA